MDCSIRKSAGQSSLTAHRSLSQLTTSFFGSQCQGIHPVLLFALPFGIVLSHYMILATLIVFYPTRFSYAHISARFVSRVAFVISRLHYFVVSSFLHYTCYSVFKVPGFCSFQNRFEKKILFSFQICFEWWAQVDSNHRPHAYQACALTC